MQELSAPVQAPTHKTGGLPSWLHPELSTQRGWGEDKGLLLIDAETQDGNAGRTTS